MASTMHIGSANSGRANPHNFYMHYQNLKIAQLTEPSFQTTVAVDIGPGRCLVATGVLVDSGADAHFIHRRLVNELGLQTHQVAPQTFKAVGAHTETYAEYVKVLVWMGGVQVKIRAYVDDSNSNMLMIIGIPGWRLFRMDFRHVGVGKKGIMKLTVARDVKYMRSIRYVVPPDDPKDRPRMLRVRSTSSWALRAREGETATANAHRMKLGLTRSQFRVQVRRIPLHVHLD